ncbi:MAG: TlpA family protein disulfide reductase [Flavobacteriaceae bacterium]|nr:TlpA family protein disulfide reductase [Flavobacteriaceae bacterium]
MKNIILLSLVLSFMACQPTETTNFSVITGKIENNTAKTITISSPDYKFHKTIKIPESNVFSDTIKSKMPSFYTISFANKRINLYLEPSFDLNLNFDTSDPENTLVFTGKGASENKYLLKKQNLSKVLKKYADYHYVGTLTEADFLQKMDSVKQAKLLLLNTTTNLSVDFKLIEKESITYNWAHQLNRFQKVKRYVSKDKTYKISDNFYAYKKDLLHENPKLNSASSYISFFASYASSLTSEAYKKDSLIDYEVTYINFIADSIKNQNLKNTLLYRDAQYAITYANDFEKYYKIFTDASTNTYNNAKIDAIYLALKKLSKGHPSPLFVNYENYKGGTTSLKDLEGKFVYVDVWATWCGPCKAEIPFLKKIEEAYHGKNIAFVSISVDTDKAHEAWRKMVKEKNMGGIQLFSDKNWNSKFVTDYMIKGIPRFILIDPDGNIISSNAPRPSSPDLKKLLAEYDL